MTATMVFRETGPYSSSYKSGYSSQYTNIKPFDNNTASVINKINRPLLIQLFSPSLDTEFITPNIVAPCNYNNDINFKLTKSTSVTISSHISAGICLIHEVTVEIQTATSLNLNLLASWFDSKPTSPEGESKVWAAVRLVTDETSPYFISGRAEVGMMSDIATYDANPEDYCLLGWYTIEITGGIITDIIELGYIDETTPKYGRRNVDLVDDGWLTPIPSNFNV
jgi:hypothetical protein